MEHSFIFRFNKNRQFVKVFLWDVHPTTFYRWKAGRWGYFLPTWKKHRIGEFGELHFVKRNLRIDTVVHELEHLRIEWIWSGGETITRRNEEKYTSFLDKLVRDFKRELRKSEPGIKL